MQIPTLQPAYWGGVYAAYGGMFIVLSILSDWGIDGVCPDRYDTMGAILRLAGTMVILYALRT
jgi:small multidrug resistance family-3 protein